MPARPPLHDLDARRIAIIKPSALGDIVHTLPVLTALRRRFPHAHIAWVVNHAFEPLLAGHPHLDATIPFHRGSSRRGFVAALRAFVDLTRRLRNEHFDLVLDLQGLFRSGLMCLATGAPRCVGLAGSREGSPWFYTDLISAPPRLTAHAVDRLWCVVEALGGGGEKQFIVPIDAVSAAWADQQLATLPRPWLMLGAGARWQTKRWPIEHFATIARRAQSVFGGGVVLVGGPDEVPIAKAIRSRLTGPSLDLTGQTSLPRLAAVLARAEVMIANDTGPLHLASALGRPVVAPYTCTQVALTGPYGQASRAVQTEVWCAGSLCKRCDRMECMSELTPARLWPALQEVLLSWHTRSRIA